MDIHYDEVKHGEEKAHLTKLYERDRARLEEAQIRAQYLRSNNGWLSLQQNGSIETGWNLDPVFCEEFTDLLTSLSAFAKYYFPGQLISQGKHFPPCCGDPEHWHSTRQGHWMITEPLSFANERHRKLFYVSDHA